MKSRVRISEPQKAKGRRAHRSKVKGQSEEAHNERFIYMQLLMRYRAKFVDLSVSRRRFQIALAEGIPHVV